MATIEGILTEMIITAHSHASTIFKEIKKILSLENKNWSILIWIFLIIDLFKKIVIEKSLDILKMKSHRQISANISNDKTRYQ